MIIVDTNVLSALMQQKPEPTVVEWLDAQPSDNGLDHQHDPI